MARRFSGSFPSALRAAWCGRAGAAHESILQSEFTYRNPANGDAPLPPGPYQTRAGDGGPDLRELERRPVRHVPAVVHAHERRGLEATAGRLPCERPDVLLDVERADLSRAVRARANDGTAREQHVVRDGRAPERAGDPGVPLRDRLEWGGAQIEQRIEARDERSGRPPPDGENTQAQRVSASVGHRGGGAELGEPVERRRRELRAAGGRHRIRPLVERQEPGGAICGEAAGADLSGGECLGEAALLEVVVLAQLEAHHVSAAQGEARVDRRAELVESPAGGGGEDRQRELHEVRGCFRDRHE